MRKIFFPLLIVTVLWLIGESCSGGHQSAADASEGPDTLHVATLYGPTSYFNYRGEDMGIEYENIRRFAKEEGMVLDLHVARNISDLIDMLQQGQVDVAAYPIPFISEFNEGIIYCGPREVTSQVLLQKKTKDKVTDVTELIGKEIFVEENSKFQYRLQNLDEELGGGIKIRPIESDTIDSEDLMEMVDKGEIEYAVIDSDIAELNKSLYPDIDASLRVSLEQASSWAVGPGLDSLAVKIDNWEKKNHNSDIVKDIYKKYYERGKTDTPEADLSFFLKKGLKKGDAVSPYDNLFKQYAKTAGYDWEFLAAVAYCESNFNPSAQSRFGATGLMQVMPISATSVGVNPESLMSPDQNVLAGAKIISSLDKALEKRVPDKDERMKFVLASYNSGLGHIYDSMALAEKQGLDPEKWIGNVSIAVLLKSRPEYYNDPVVKHGYFRGRETADFVYRVLSTYHYLKNLSSKT